MNGDRRGSASLTNTSVIGILEVVHTVAVAAPVAVPAVAVAVGAVAPAYPSLFTPAEV